MTPSDSHLQPRFTLDPAWGCHRDFSSRTSPALHTRAMPTSAGYPPFSENPIETPSVTAPTLCPRRGSPWGVTKGPWLSGCRIGLPGRRGPEKTRGWEENEGSMFGHPSYLCLAPDLALAVSPHSSCSDLLVLLGHPALSRLQQRIPSPRPLGLGVVMADPTSPLEFNPLHAPCLLLEP